MTRRISGCGMQLPTCSRLKEFVALCIEAARALDNGPAKDPAKGVGPMVLFAHAERLMATVDDAGNQGGRAVLALTFGGCTVNPGTRVHALREHAACCEKPIGLPRLVERAADPQEPLNLSDVAPFGLQSAMFTYRFTYSLKRTVLSVGNLDLVVLWINLASRSQFHPSRFCGNKSLGLGRESLGYAIEERSQLNFFGLGDDA